MKVLRGMNMGDIANLDHEIQKFVAPRLREFREAVKERKCHPCNLTYEEWIDILDKMVVAFEHHDYDCNIYWDEYAETLTFPGDEETKEYYEARRKFEAEEERLLEQQKEGLELFAKWFRGLWL